MNKKKVIAITVAILAALAILAVVFFVLININRQPSVTVDQQPISQLPNETNDMKNQVIFTGSFQGMDDIH